MFYSIVLNALPAWIMAVALLYSLRSLSDATNAPAGFPLTGILLGVTGSVGATSFLICTLIILLASNVATTVLSVSRLTWAWARDGALWRPLSLVRRHAEFGKAGQS